MAGASTDHWRHNLPVLESYEVHALDLLGFGRSAKLLGVAYGERCGDLLCAHVRERIGRPTALVVNSPVAISRGRWPRGGPRWWLLNSWPIQRGKAP